MALFEGLFNLVKANLVFARTGEDVATFGIHCAPLRDGLIADSEPTNDELDLITARLRTLWAALDGFYPPELSFDRIVYQNAGPKVTMANGHLVGVEYDGAGHRVPGQPPAFPALRADVINLPGNSETIAQLPSQVAITVTERTVARRQWGRVYLPAGDIDMVQNSNEHAVGAGQIKTAAVDAIRTAFGVLLDGLDDDNIPWVVWSVKHQHALSVDTIQVDSLFDVQRSRREDKAFHFATHTRGA